MKLLNWFISIFKRWGVFGVVAIVTLYTPTWLGFITGNKELQEFGLRWVIIWAAPFPPALLVIFLLAALYKWLWVQLVKVYHWFVEIINKLQLQNQFITYLTSEEIHMILAVAKKVDAESQEKIKKFKERLRKERLKMLDDKWTQEVQNDNIKKEK